MDKKDESLRIAELEMQIAELKRANAKLRATVEEFRNKEQTISSAIIASMEHANQLEASRKKLYSLDIQRTRLMYLRMEQIINDLYNRYPELRKDSKLKDMNEKFKTMVFNDINEKNKETPVLQKQPTADPIRKLLHNIIDCFDSKQPIEYESKLKVNAINEKEEVKTNDIKPFNFEEFKNEFKFEHPTTQKENSFMQSIKTVQPNESGFDINEALNPTMGLDEILKAFNLGPKASDGNK